MSYRTAKPLQPITSILRHETVWGFLLTGFTGRKQFICGYVRKLYNNTLETRAGFLPLTASEFCMWLAAKAIFDRSDFTDLVDNTFIL